MRLNVLLHGELAGWLDNDGGSLSFRYDESYLGLEHDRQSPPSGRPALSVRLPLRSEPYGQRDTLVYFANLLPEDRLREMIARGAGISPGNDFEFLKRFGGDCAGAVTLIAEEDSPSASPATSPDEEIPPDRLDELLARADTVPLLVAGAKARLSLAGAQSKLPVIVKDGRYYLPTDSSRPTTHILKPTHRDFDDLVSNEFICMRLARAVGLKVAHVERRATTSGVEYLEVARYDRDPLKPRRLHQEDFCQALGFLPTEKYQAEGGPTLRQSFSLIDMVSGVPVEDKLLLWSAVTFNFLIGNCDAHGKNFSLLYESRVPRLAPLYDLVSTAAYPTLDEDMAMTIGAGKSLASVNARSFSELAKDCRLNAGEALRRSVELAAAVARELPGVMTDGVAGSAVIESVAHGIGNRVKLLTVG